MTKQSETPARRANSVRINEDNNEVQVIRVENADAAPSIAARNHGKAAVASHPEAIQCIAMSLSKEFVSLKAKFQQKSKMQTKLDGDDNFIPRSKSKAVTHSLEECHISSDWPFLYKTEYRILEFGCLLNFCIGHFVPTT